MGGEGGAGVGDGIRGGGGMFEPECFFATECAGDGGHGEGAIGDGAVDVFRCAGFLDQDAALPGVYDGGGCGVSAPGGAGIGGGAYAGIEVECDGGRDPGSGEDAGLFCVCVAGAVGDLYAGAGGVE